MLFIVAVIAPIFITTFGGRFPYYQDLLIGSKLPEWIWGFANFDGVHYMTIAKSGYAAQYTQAFFPLYPVVVNLFRNVFDFLELNQSLILSGLLVSNILFLATLLLIYKLFQLDFPRKISMKAVMLFVSFPTAFYFGSLYSESLFFFLTALALYFMRKKYFLFSAIVIALASATRIFGVLLILPLIYELWVNRKERFIKVPLYSLIGALGLVAYMTFLGVNFSDPLYFLSAQPIFGAERTNSSIVLFPQVAYRYISIFFSVSITNTSFWIALMEFLFTVVSLGVVLLAIKRIRLSYVIFVLSCLLLPSITGTFSSMPRYALIVLILSPFIVIKSGRYYYLIVGLFVILQIILTAFFVRGYWIS